LLVQYVCGWILKLDFGDDFEINEKQ